MANMTSKEIELMRSGKTDAEWNANCNTVKAAHGGYPADWYAKIVMSDLMTNTAAKFKDKTVSGAVETVVACLKVM